MIPTQIDNVSVVSKASIYFDGKVVSHNVLLADGTKQTLGLIYPGAYTFNTGAPERMDMVAGSARYRLKGVSEWTTVPAGEGFNVPGDSSFEIAADAIVEYLCSFLART